MIFGEKSVFAVECEFTSQEGSWVYGSFRVWLAGSAIGTYSEEVLNLTGTTGVLREPVQASSILAGRLGSTQFLRRVFEPNFGNGENSQKEQLEWGRYRWLAYCEGFETVFSAAALVGHEVRIVWRLTDQGPVNECFIPLATYSAVCAKFVAWLDHELEERRRGIQ